MIVLLGILLAMFVGLALFALAVSVAVTALICAAMLAAGRAFAAVGVERR